MLNSRSLKEESFQYAYFFFFSPLDLDIYITLKHFETPAGSKRRFKNKIIAINVLVSYKERTVVLVLTDCLHLLFE